MQTFARLFFTITFGLFLFASQPMAQTIMPPTEPVLLTVSGKIKTANVGNTLALDRAALSALKTTEFETTTIWTDGLHRFTGVSLKTIIDLLGVTQGRLLATAINDYTVEIPVSDAIEEGPIIAFLIDGQEMSLREKGPLWIVYPYDANSIYQSEVIYSRSIWQVDRIEVVE